MDCCNPCLPLVELLGKDLMCADSVVGAQRLHQAINYMNDGQVFVLRQRLKLNILTDRIDNAKQTRAVFNARVFWVGCRILEPSAR